MGELPDGRAVRCHEIGSDWLSLHVMELGASVHRLVAHGVDIALGHATVSEYVSQRDFLGATVGRYANRIRHGTFTLDGHEWRVPANDRGNALHGGPDGFDRRLWTTTGVSANEVTMELVSPDGDQGFPGRLQVEVGYRVEGGQVTLSYCATTDRPTVVNLTNHTFFNLDGEGSGTIDDHVVSVPADRVTVVDASGLPTGELMPVAGTPLDLRAGVELRGRGLDHNYVPEGSGLRPVARLTSPRSGRVLEVSSDLPGLQVYTGNILDGSTVGRSGSTYSQGAGIALETQHFPDAPNQPTFPSTVLRPGTVWESRTVWDLS